MLYVKFVTSSTIWLREISDNMLIPHIIYNTYKRLYSIPIRGYIVRGYTYLYNLLLINNSISSNISSIQW